MRDALAELIRLVRQFRVGVPWNSSELAFRRLPLLAVLLAWSTSVGFAASLWYVSPVYMFNPWALVTLVIPAASGFYLTYLFDLLEIGLGWRTLDVLFQAAFSTGIYVMASDNGFGLAAGLLSTACAWAVGVRVGSDLVSFRPDRIVPGEFDRYGVLIHQGLHRLIRSLLAMYGSIALSVGFLARWQSVRPAWWVATMAGVGAAFALALGLTIVGWTRALVDRRTWEANEVVIRDGIESAWHRWVWQMGVVAGALGLILPANISPLGRLSFDNLFRELSTRVAPWFVRSGGTYQSSATLQVGEQVGTGFLGLGAIPGGSIIQGIFYVALIIGVVWVLRRALPLLRAGEQNRPMGWESQRGIWRWLWESIRGWFRSATKRLFDPTTSNEHVTGAKRTSLLHKRSKRWQMPTEPQALVRFLFAHFLETAASHGHKREADETVAEFQQRLVPKLPSDKGAAVTDFTGLYQRVKYGAEPADQSIAAACKRFWAAAVRALRYIGSV